MRNMAGPKGVKPTHSQDPGLMTVKGAGPKVECNIHTMIALLPSLQITRLRQGGAADSGNIVPMNFWH